MCCTYVCMYRCVRVCVCVSQCVPMTELSIAWALTRSLYKVTVTVQVPLGKHE